MPVQQAHSAITKEPLSAVDTIPQLARTPSHSASDDEKTDHSEPVVDAAPKIIPLRYRLATFAMILFFATGSSYAEATLSPLKSTLVKKLKINNAQYGAIASASSLVNTILPIIGGIGMDHWGAT